MTEQTAPAHPDPDPEGVEITPTGLVHLRIDGEDYWLRRPKIGEMRRLEEAVVAAAHLQTERFRHLAERVEAATEAASDTAEGETPDAAEAEQLTEVVEAVDDASVAEQAVIAALLECWREMVRTLERDRRTLPAEDDDLPPWLANFDLLGEVRKGWRRLPWLAAPRP